MRRFAFMVPIIFLWQSFSYGQNQNEKSKYFIELNQFITESGFAMGSELRIKINPNNKNLSFGVFYCPELKKISGLSFQHEIMLWREKRFLKNLVKPYIFYDFIYRKTKIPEVGADKNMERDMVSYTSMEHYIGVGLKANISKSLHAGCDLGFGTYLGSIKKPSAPDSVTGEIMGTNGFGSLIELYIGYNIF